jgi:AbrB family looped-hinge helix DNA binding protein
MSEVTVSSKYQIVIPKKIRETCNIKPGDKYGMLAIGKSVHLIKVVPMEDLFGFLPGIDPTIEREEDREL